MSYPIATNLTYTAVAATVGLPADTFSYSWAFDDGATGDVASLAKAWATPGTHTATVTATDNTTGGLASASKSVFLIDPAMAFTWHDTGKSLTTAASGFANFEHGKTFMFGNKLISFGSFYYKQDVNVYDMDLGTLTLYSGVLPSGGFGGVRLIPAGSLVGKVLLFGNNSGNYGYWDLLTNTYTQISATGGPGRVSSAFSLPSIAIGDNILISWQDYDYAYFPCVFNTTTNTFGTKGTNTYQKWREFFTLPSGNVLALTDNSDLSAVYNIGTGAITTITGASGYPGGITDYGVSLPNGKVFQIGSQYGNTFDESLGSWALGTNRYPYNSQYGGSSSNYYSNYVITPGGDVLEVGGTVNAGSIFNKPYVVFYSTNIGTFSVMGASPIAGAGFCYYYGNKFFAIQSSNGEIFYSDPWTW